ncbi:pyridine nucleotide-disulfide oxidoreductase domain-containing protein 2 isoform X3 [Anas platyrhynchos]|uniref:pyridine nucleotide-disulfide oxidoreductase domain-containing protein 2 isoform X3 n=1 Tax=Anas platyrhynchos TaxID=8839 RepID=UPI003AF29EE2
MGCTGCKLCLRAAPGHGGAELGSQHAAEPRQPMCSPDTSGVGARASPLGRHWCSPCTASGPCSRCPVQLGLGTEGRGALDHSGAFAPSCQAGICPAEHKLWVRSQAQPQAAPFPAAPGGLSCRQDVALHTASPQPPCTPQAMLGRGLVPCCGHRVLPSLPASPGTQRPALCQRVPCPGPPVPSPCPMRSVAVEAKSRSCRHCMEMAAGLPARLGTGCAARGLRGRRLAHSGAAARLQQEYDAVVIGAGHNGLVAAAYLQRAGLRTAVLEKRHVLGGAAVTEEIVPGFKFSRASYLLSLLRPQIYSELELQRHGLRVLPRDPYSFTPLLEDRSPPRSLLLGHDMAQTQRQIAQFSQKDAQAYPEYEAFMGCLVAAIDPLLDTPPVDTAALGQGSLLQRLRSLQALQPLLRAGLALGRQLPRYYEVLTAPISKILDHWFESEPLKATLATDAVIGAMSSPHSPGSGYVLLHHVMGELEGRRGAWGYVAGGMGALSQAIARAAASRGAHIFTEKAVSRVLLGRDGQAQGVVLRDGTEVRSKVVLSNASPQITFLELTPQEQLPEDFTRRIRHLDTRSPVTKINGACTPVSSPHPSGSGSPAQLPGCPQRPRRPAPAPPPVLHPPQLRGHTPPAPGLHRGRWRAPLQQAYDRAVHPLGAGPGAGPTGLPRRVPLHPVHPVRAGRWAALGRAG